MPNDITTYKVNPLSPGELKDLISKKTKQAIENNQTYQWRHENSKQITFANIRMRKDHLYYNIQNDRTLIATKEFAQENGKDAEYFGIGNSFELEQQSSYHKIICSFISNAMRNEFNRTRDQRFPVYITSEGILANGNTRLSCWREMDMFDEIDCRVFPEELSSEWDLIREVVDEQDNAKDIKQEYKWYARSERMIMNIKEWGEKVKNNAGKINYSLIAQKMKYKNASDAENNHKMYLLAQEFIDTQNFPNFKKVSDLDNLGSDSGVQAFETLAKSKKSKETSIDEEILERITRNCFEIMGTGHIDPYKSTHLAIQGQWDAGNILRLKKELDESGDATVDVLGGESKKTEEKNFISKPYHGHSKEDRKKILEDELNAAKLASEKRKDKNVKLLFKKKINKIISDLDFTSNNVLEPSSDLSGVDVLLEKLEKQIEEIKNKVSEIKNNR